LNVERVIFHSFLWKGESVKCFSKLKPVETSCIFYPEVEVHVAKQSPTELIELGFLVLETSLLLLRMIDTRIDKKAMKFWVKRISRNANTLPELLWKEGEHVNQMMVRKQNKEPLELFRYRISSTIQTLFSFEENDRARFKMEQIHVYFGKWDWIKN